MKFTRNKSTGFTMIESVVSIGLLVFAITGPMVLSTQSLRASRDARLELEATHLAEEGVEIVRNIRDNASAADNSADHSGWLGNIVGNCGEGRVCAVTAEGLGELGWNAGISITQAAAGAQEQIPLYKEIATGVYAQKANGNYPPNQWKKSEFSRNIKINTIVPNRQVRVTSTVTYKSFSGVVRKVEVTEDLLNWFPCLPNACP